MTSPAALSKRGDQSSNLSARRGHWAAVATCRLLILIYLVIMHFKYLSEKSPIYIRGWLIAFYHYIHGYTTIMYYKWVNIYSSASTLFISAFALAIILSLAKFHYVWFFICGSVTRRQPARHVTSGAFVRTSFPMWFFILEYIFY